MSVMVLTLTMFSKCGGVSVGSSHHQVVISHSVESTVDAYQNESIVSNIEDMMTALYHETEEITNDISVEVSTEILTGLDDFVKQAYWIANTNLQPIRYGNLYFGDRMPINHLGWTEETIKSESKKVSIFLEDVLIHFRRPDENREWF